MTGVKQEPVTAIDIILEPDATMLQHAEAVNALVKVFLANDVRCYVRTCEMLGTEDLRPLLASIKAPTAVVVGAEDYATPVSMAAQKATLRMASSRELKAGLLI